MSDIKSFNLAGKDIGFLNTNSVIRPTPKGNIAIYKVTRKGGKLNYQYKKWISVKRFNAIVKDSYGVQYKNTFYKSKLRQGFAKIELGRVVRKQKTILESTGKEFESTLIFQSKKQAAIYQKLKANNKLPVVKRKGVLKESVNTTSQNMTTRRTKEQVIVETKSPDRIYKGSSNPFTAFKRLAVPS